jgi:Leucine-rich repeat (LRR) protein
MSGIQFFTITFILFGLVSSGGSQTYTDDSLIVLEILRANGIDTIPVLSVAGNSNGRVYSLNLGDRDIHVLPECLGELTELVYLDIVGNRLTSLPESIGQLSKLEHMSAYENDIYELPAGFGGLQSLKTIYLIRNNLTRWPEVFQEIPGIEMIDVGGNHLTAVPEEIAGYPSLKKLYINDNFLSELPEAFTALELEVVHVAGNALCEVSETLAAWLDGCDYYKEDSKWKTYQHCQQFEEDSAAVRDLLDNNGWTSMPVESVVEVVDGDIVGIDLSAETRGAYDPLAKRLTGEVLPIVLSEGIDTLKHLRKLNLSGNGLESLPDWFSRLCHLETLDLSDNRLSTLPELIASFRNLADLDLSGNLLEDLPPSVEAWADALDPDWKSGQQTTAVSCRQERDVNSLKCTVNRTGSGMARLDLWIPQLTFAEITLYSLDGKVMEGGEARNRFPAGSHAVELGRNMLSRGVYLVKVSTSSSGNLVLRFIVH